MRSGRAEISAARRAAVSALLLAALAGCAPSADAIRADLAASRHRGSAIAAVPFFRQADRQCGPAALACVLAFHGARTEPGEIARAIYAPSIRGTLTFDLPWFAREKGLFADEGGFGFEQVLGFLDQGLPVVALVDPGVWFLRSPHYVVLTGYDRDASCLILHDGADPDRVWRFSEFLRSWRRTNRWSMVALPWDRGETPAGLYDYHYVRFAERAAGQNDPARAERLFLRALAENPAARDARHAYALFLLGRPGRGADAVRISEECLERARAARRDAPGMGAAEAANLLAWILLKTGGDLARAEALAREAAGAAEATKPQALDTLGCVLGARGKAPEALASFERAWALRDRLSESERRDLASRFAPALRTAGRAAEAEAVEKEARGVP
ncbi:MAG: C39 family peptidase [Planctomycetota bacterium]